MTPDQAYNRISASGKANPKIPYDLRPLDRSDPQTVIALPYTPRKVFLPYHRRKQRFAAIVAHRRCGKAVSLETLVPLAAGGFKTMAEIVDGDRLFDERGQPTTVLMAHPVMIGRPCYEVEFDTGEVVVCDAEHLWFTQTKADRTNHTGKRQGPRGAVKYVERTWAPRPGSVRTTAEIAQTLTARGETNHGIPLAGALEFAEAELPVEPYILGVWLGDGTSRSAQFTTMDVEIVEALKAFAEAEQFQFRAVHSANTGRATTYSVTGLPGGHTLRSVLGEMGLLRNKHIPDLYQSASVAQRQALLAGLMDTDGTVDPKQGGRQRRGCSITQKSRALADGIVRLLAGLGLKPRINLRTIKGVDYYNIRFSPQFNPFRLKRKSERLQLATTAWNRASQKHFIVDARPCPSVPVRCLTVDSPSHLYLVTESLIPTHNTVAEINECIVRISRVERSFPPPQAAYISPTFSQGKRNAWLYAKHYTRNIPGMKFLEAETTLVFPNEARLILAGSDNYGGLRGVYLDHASLDEYAIQDPRIWTEVIRASLSEYAGSATFIGSAYGRNHFYDLIHDFEEDPDWLIMKLKASETGILTQKELDLAKKAMPTEEYLQEYECSFDAAVKGTFFGAEIERAENEHRITQVSHDTNANVLAAMDLGIGGGASVWVYQLIANNIHMLKFVQDKDQALPYYVDWMNRLPYKIDTLYVPHDAEQRDQQTGLTRTQFFQSRGFNTFVLPKVSEHGSIAAARVAFSRCWFDKSGTKDGLDCLRMFRRAWDHKRRVFSENAFKDWSSHGGDGFRYVIQSTPYGTNQSDWSKPIRRNLRVVV